jgi:hypothetical protein
MSHSSLGPTVEQAVEQLEEGMLVRLSNHKHSFEPL